MYCPRNATRRFIESTGGLTGYNWITRKIVNVSTTQFHSRRWASRAPPPTSVPPPVPPPGPPPVPPPNHPGASYSSEKYYTKFTTNFIDGNRLRTKDALMHMVTDCPASSSHKVTVVGVGAVGMACAFSILTQNVSNEVSLVDSNPKKLEGEVLDLQHGSAFIRNAQISGSPGKNSWHSEFCWNSHWFLSIYKQTTDKRPAPVCAS